MPMSASRLISDNASPILTMHPTRSLQLLIGSAAMLVAHAAPAASSSWNVDANGNWATAANPPWFAALVPGSTSSTTNADVAAFGFTLTLDRTVTVDASRNLRVITFSNTSTNKYTLSGGGLLLSNGGVIQTAAGNGDHADTISTAIVIEGDGGSATFTAGASSAASALHIGAVTGVATGANVTTLTLNGENVGDNVITGVIGNGTGGGKLALTKTGNGTWSLTGNNTFSGQLTVAQGVLKVATVNNTSANGVLGNSASAVILGKTGGLTGTLEFTGGNTGSNKKFTLASGGSGAFQVDTAGSVLTLSGTIDGGGTLIKTGAGTLSLSGTNTLSGGTRLADGVLSLAGSDALGVAGILSFEGGTLRFSAGNTTDYSARFSPAAAQAYNIDTNSQVVTLATPLTSVNGMLTKTGAGTLNLTAINTYNGGTTVSAGTLTVAGTGTLGATTGTLTLEGATAIVNLGATSQTLDTVNLWNGAQIINGSISAAFFNLDSGSISANLGGATAVLTKSTTGTVSLTGTNSHGGGTVLAEGVLALGSSGALGATGNLLFSGGTLQFSASNTSDYSARFSQAANQTFNFDTNGQTVTLASALISSGGSLTKAGAGTLTLTGNNTYNGGTTVTAGTLAISGGGKLGVLPGSLTADGATAIVNLGATTQTLDTVYLWNGAQINTGTLVGTSFNVESGSISTNLAGATAILTKSNTGVVTLTGTNAYGGGTELYDGVLVMGSSGALGTTGTISFYGGTLRFSASNTNDYSSRFNNADYQIYNLDTNSQSVTLASPVTSFGGTLTKSGAGTLTLTGINSYDGGTTVTAGTLALAGAGTPGASSGALMANGGTVVVNLGTNNQTLGAIGLKGGAQITGGGTLTGTSYDVESGSVSVRLAGAGVALTKTTAGTVTLSAANSYDGGTTVNAGTLTVSGLGTLGAGSGTLLVNGSTAILNLGATNQTLDVVTLMNGGQINSSTGILTGNAFSVEKGSISAILAGPGAVLTKTTAGIVTLTGANTYGGGTIVTEGKLVLSGSGTLGASAGALTVDGPSAIVDLGATNQTYGTVTVLNGGQILSSTGILTGASVIVENGLVSARITGATTSLTKTTGGTVTLAGINDYGGATHVNEGMLQVTTLAALPGQSTPGLITVATTATLAVNAGGSGQFTVGDITNLLAKAGFAANSILGIDTTNASGGTFAYTPGLGGAIGLRKLGAGTLTLSGSNTYSGGTAVNAGTLLLSGAGTLGATSGGLTADGPAAIVNLGGSGQTVAAVGLLNGAQINNGTLTGASFHVESGAIGANLAGAAASLTKREAGTVTLTGTNTYGGGTDLYDGVLGLGSSGALGTTGTLRLLGGTLRFSAGNTTDYSARFSAAAGQFYNFDTNGQAIILASALTSTTDLSGGGTLTKTGTGTLTLKGANTYNGGTTVSAGTLLIAGGGKLGAAPGGLSVEGDATLVDLGASIQTLGAVSLLNGAQILNGTLNATSFDVQTGTLGAKLAGAGAVLTKSGDGTVTLTGANTYGGGTNLVAGVLALGSSGALGGSGTLGLLGGTLQFSASNTIDYSARFSAAEGQYYKFDTNGQNVTLAAAMNSVGGTLTKTGGGTLTLTGFNTYGGGTTVSAGTLALAGGGRLGMVPGGLTVTGVTAIVDLGATTQTLDVVSLENGAQINNGTLSAAAFDVASGAISANLTGADATLTKTTSGTVTLTGVNTYTGTTSVSAGTLWAPTLATLPGRTVTGMITVASGATLAVNAGGSGEFSTSNITELLTNGVFDANAILALDTTNAAGGIVAYSADITAPIGLRKSGSGTLTLSGSNTYGGGTTVSALTGFSAGTLSFNSLSDIPWTTSALGTSGAILISNSTFQYTGSVVTSTSRFQSGGATGPVGTTTIEITQPGASLELVGGYSENQNLVKSGTGTLVLSGSNAVGFGGTSVDNGTLVLAMNTSNPAAYNAVGWISDVKPGATVRLAMAADGSYHDGQVLAMSGDPLRQFHMSGGTLDLNGDNVNRIPVVDGSGTVTNSAAGTSALLNVLLNYDRTFSGNIVDGGGTLALRVSDTAHTGTVPDHLRWTLSGNNTYSGGTALASNTLLAITPSSLGSNWATPGMVTVALNAKLAVQTGNGITGWSAAQIDSLRTAAAWGTPNAGLGLDTTQGDFTYASAVAQTLRLVKLGSNTLTLTGANSYTGGTILGDANHGDAGTLLLSGAGTLGTTGPLVVYAGTLDLNGSTQTITTLAMGEGASGTSATISIGAGELRLGGNFEYRATNNPNGATISGTGGGILSLLGTRTFTVGDSTATACDLTLTANIQNGDATARALLKAGTGVMLLSGTNTYTGATTVNAGTLRAATVASLPNQTLSGMIRVASAATLALNVGGPGEFTETDVTRILANALFAANGILGIDTTHTVGGTFTSQSNIMGVLGLSKLGTGTLVLPGTNNSYSGPTSVSAGTLQVNGVLTSGGLVSVPGGILGVAAGASIARDVTLSGGGLNLAGTLGAGSTLTLYDGTVNATGSGASAASVMLPLPAGTAAPVLYAPAGQELAVSNKLTQNLSDAIITVTAGGMPVKVGGTNIATNIDKLILQGGTTKVERSSMGYVAGLQQGFLQGDTGAGVDFITPNPKNEAPQLNILAARANGNGLLFMNNVSGSPTNHATQVYTGQIFVGPSGTLNFGKGWDDSAIIKVDGITVLQSDDYHRVNNCWRDQVTSGTLTYIPNTWHDFEVRVANNVGGWGCTGETGWSAGGFGIGYSPTFTGPAGYNITAAQQTNYVEIADDGHMSLLRFSSMAPSAVTLPATDVTVTADSTLNLNNASLATLGNLNLAAATLAFETATGVSFDNITATDNSAIAASVPLSLRTGSVTVSNGKTLTLNPSIIDGTTPTALHKLGTGTLLLGGGNTYAGVTTVSGGMLQFAKQISLYNNTPANWTAAKLVVAAGATAAFNVGGTGEFTTSDIQGISGLGTLSGGFANGSSLGIDTSNASGGVFAYSHVIANPNNGANGLGLTKMGAGTLVLDQANTYTGATRVKAGTLLVNGNSPAATGPVSVDSGATLGGSGSLGASTTIDGMHAPGNNSVGIQVFSNSLAYAATSHLQWQLTDNVSSGRGSSFDGVDVTGGTFAITHGATIDLSFAGSVNFLNAFWSTNQSWLVADLGSGITGDGGSTGFALGTISGGSGSPSGSFAVTRAADANGKQDVILNWTAGSGFDLWVASSGLGGADALPTADPDHDGVPNALEFVLGGEPNPANPGSNSSSLLPKITRNPGGDLIFTFHRKDLSESSTALTFQWSTSLGFPDSNNVPVGGVSSSSDGVNVAVTENSPDADTDLIVITVPAAKAAGGKLFGRLGATVP